MAATGTSDHIKYRGDIDGLRAFSVLSVVGFHAFPDVLPGGFVGVDVFFVISGYLISTIIFADLAQGRFSLGNFYARRIRRIFPALLLVLLGCLLFGWFALLASEFTQLGKHVAAGAGFVSNFALARENGYFANSADTKPLLHLWSLGIEEQFYIFWPLLAWCAWKARLNPLTGILILAAVSFGLCIRGTRVDATSAFYHPLYRAWELFAGAAIAVGAGRLPWRFSVPASLTSRGAANWLSVGAFVSLVAFVCLVPKEIRFPGWWALIPVISAVLIIAAGRGSWLNESLLSQPLMKWFGLISFPLYLWHWPLLSFARIIEGETPAIGVRMGAVGLSILLAWLTFRIVELPIRSQRVFARASPAILLAGLVAIGAAGWHTWVQGGFPGRHQAIEAYNDLPAVNDAPLSSSDCATRLGNLYAGGFIPERDICLWRQGANSREPAVLFIGDSHALRLYEAFLETGGGKAAVAGRGSCAPILDAAHIGWLKCQPTGNNIIDFGIRSDFKLLIVTGVFERYFDGTYPAGKDADGIERDIRRGLEQLAKSGKEVLVVLDNPSLPFDSRRCLKRPIGTKTPPDCSFDRARHEEKTGTYKALFRKHAADLPNIRLLDAGEQFCNETRCFAFNDQGLTYTGDNNHLSLRGAHLVVAAARKMYPHHFGNPGPALR